MRIPRHRYSQGYASVGLWLLAAASVQAASVATRAIKINDSPIAPSSDIEAQPGDVIEAEIYIFGWNEDGAGSTIRTYQVTFDAHAFFNGSGIGALFPLGWDAAPITGCGEMDSCPIAMPLCSIFATCGCILGDTCPAEFPICNGICVAAGHNPEGAFAVDINRPDFIHFGFVPVAAARAITAGADPAIGSTVLSGLGPTDAGQLAYAGTLHLQVSEDTCGEFVVSYSKGPDATFLLLNGAPDAVGFQTLEPLTVTVPSDAVCPQPLATLVSSDPLINTQLSRLRRNTIILGFDRDLVAPQPGELAIYKLTEDNCFGPGPGQDLSGIFDISIRNDEHGRPRRLRLRDTSAAGVMEHRAWYRVANQGAWGSADPFFLDYQVQMGDANNNGFVSFADLSLLHMSIPTLEAADNDRMDINADGFINFADLAAANVHIPSKPTPRPCQK